MRRASKAKRPKQNNAASFKPPLRETSWGGDGTVICPDSVRIKLPFTQVLAPGTTSGGLYVYQYRANSCFDPDYSGTGLQPNGFDQWSQFFNEYVVLSSEVIVEYVASGSYVGELVVVPSFNSSAPSNTKEATGWRYAKSVMGVPSGNATYHKIISKMSTAQMCGVPPAAVLLDASDWGASVSTSPASLNTWYWDIFLQNVSSSTTLGDYLRVTIMYDVKFFAPVQQALSAVQRHDNLPGSQGSNPQGEGGEVTRDYRLGPTLADPSPSAFTSTAGGVSQCSVFVAERDRAAPDGNKPFACRPKR